MFQGAAHRSAEDDSDRKDLFGPVADLMVGVIFVFLLLMVAMTAHLAPEDANELKREVARLQVEAAALRRQATSLRQAKAQLEQDLQQERVKSQQLQHQVTAQTRARQAAEAAHDQALRQLQDTRHALVRATGRLARQALQLADVRQQLDLTRRDRARLIQFARFIRKVELVDLLERLARADDLRRQVLEDLRSRLEAEQIKVIVDPEAGTLSLPDGRVFRRGSAEPTEEGKAVISALGRALSATLPCYTDAPRTITSGDLAYSGDDCAGSTQYSEISTIYIEGHTDITGSAEINWRLSTERAVRAFQIVIRDFEILRGIRNRQGQSLLGVSGYADTRPADPRPEIDRTRREIADADRRIELRVTMAANRRTIGTVLDQLNTQLEAIDVLITD